MMLRLTHIASYLKVLKPVSISLLARDGRVLEKAQTLVAYYYYILPFAAFIFATNPILERPNFDPIWPLLWVDTFAFSLSTVVIAVKFFFILASLAAIFFYQHRSMRFLVFVALWQVHALESSFGSPNHQWYMWLYTSLIFVFLPTLGKSNKNTFELSRRFLLAVWTAQAVVMLMYTMAGYHKISEGIQQWYIGEIGSFSINGFAYHIAYWVPKLQTEAILAAPIIQHPFIGWIPFVAMMFIQFFSLWTMVRPSLHRIWGATLVAFHFGTFFTMGISFHPHIVLVMLLFLNSPFVKEKYSIGEFINDLPVIGQILDWYRGRFLLPR